VPHPFLASIAARWVAGRGRLPRGMSPWHDLIDWIGGYPSEVASPEAVTDFFRARGFTIDKLRTTNRMGCNEFVFVRAGR
jgi:hypothetical protein